MQRDAVGSLSAKEGRSMKRNVAGLVVVAVLAGSAPAWSLGGCPPTSKDADKCETGIAKALGKFVGAVIKCHTKQADGAFKQKPADDEGCESDTPDKSAKAKLDAAIAKVEALCPPGVVGNATALENELLTGSNSLDAMNARVYCDATSGTPIDADGDDAGWVPASKDGSKCADGVGKGVAHLWGAIAKCSTKTADASFKGKSFDEAGCRTAATAKYDAAGGKLKGCPGCLDPAARASLRDAILARLDAADGAIFVCSSPTTTTTVSSTTSTLSTTTTTTTSTTSTTLVTSITCPAGGTVDVAMILVPTPTTFNSTVIEGIQVELTYPGTVSMPGTHFLPVNDPADPTTLIVLLSADPNGINLYDGSQTFFDADTSSPLKLKTLLTLNPTANLIFNQVVPFERARFTCTPGAALSAASLPCVVTSEVDVTSRPIPPDQRPACNVTLSAP
jgi:hypothetical protein